MVAYLIVSIASGILFGFLDGVINANALAPQALRDLQTHRKNFHQPA
jgi:hypothetical protein